MTTNQFTNKKKLSKLDCVKSMHLNFKKINFGSLKFEMILLIRESSVKSTEIHLYVQEHADYVTNSVL